MITASIYGRLGRDPQQRQTKTGNAMATCSIAVDATPGNAEEQETVWFNILSFGRAADVLAKHSKGDLVSIVGNVTQSRWTTADGEERTNLTIIADQVMSARTVRPGGGRKANSKPPVHHKPGPTEYALAGGAAVDFDDDIPF